MINVGCVLFKKGDESGTLNAKWCHSYWGNVTGKATGCPVEGFVGRYHIHYFDDKGNVHSDRELDIKKDCAYYELAWINNGEISGRRIGMEVTEGLAAGWRGIDDKLQKTSEIQE